jgi:hypothetical protein
VSRKPIYFCSQHYVWKDIKDVVSAGWLDSFFS